MKLTLSVMGGHQLRYDQRFPAIPLGGLCRLALLASAIAGTAAEPASKSDSTWPQPYAVQRDAAAGILTFRTPYYSFEHDLRKGGAITRIALQHGKAANLLVRPIETRVRDEGGAVFSDLKDSAPKVTHRQAGLNELVTVECTLADAQGRPSALRLKTTFEYRWGYVRVHKEFLFPAGGFSVRELCPFSTALVASLSDYGYREGLSEADGASPFSFGSNRWGKLRQGQPSDLPLQIAYVPRSMIFIDPGVEGLEWFLSSNLAQWESAPSGRRGQGRCSLQLNAAPSLALSISPLWSTNAALRLTNTCTFDFRLAIPLLEGHAHPPWVHTSFNRNRGDWVSTETIRHWAEQGYQTVHCHNDGDYYDDGRFWRDGSYPPYPDMDRYDQVLKDCHRAGIRTATYFSNKELHPSTREFQDHGAAWGRKNRHGDLQHNFFRGRSEFGAQMCLRSGWLDFLKLSIDRVLKNHPLDGVYYDWNVALFCCNPLHEAGLGERATARGHWDMDELLDLMEWTRDRVGPNGLIIVHDTTTPMFATENFANYVVATEWGYRKWKDQAAELQDLPSEWSLAGARPRGVISYGTIDSKAPRRLHKVFALEAFLGGVTPWPAGPETLELLPLLKPLGDFEGYQFADWRCSAVSLSDRHCAAAVYSRPGEAYLLLANLDQTAKEVTAVFHPEKLPHPLARVSAATRMAPNVPPANHPNQRSLELDAVQFVGPGIKIPVPGDDAVLIRVR